MARSSLLAVLLVAACAGGAPASSRCTIPSHPTASHHAECAGANLRFRDLRHLDLSWGNFSGAVLEYAQLQHVTAVHAQFRHAFLRGANFAGADLTHGDFRGAILCHTRQPNGALNNANC